MIDKMHLIAELLVDFRVCKSNALRDRIFNLNCLRVAVSLDDKSRKPQKRRSAVAGNAEFPQCLLQGRLDEQRAEL